MAAASVGDEMERLRDQVSDRGERRRDGADSSLRLTRAQPARLPGSFHSTVIDAALGKEAQ